jgi:serine/threonine-protein kinase
MDAERWQRLSPLLDALIELDPDARARSLALMREEDPRTAADLEGLLQLELEREDFLSEPLVAPLPGPRPGAHVGPYRLERLIGEGGMGQVWLAARADGLYQRHVALKLLRPGLADPNLRLRFTRERQILARLAHPHIARLLDAGISGDHQPYLALEYIEGEPVTDYCRKRRLSLDSRLELFAQVCAAVSHAHANLIVHRDLKPSNILVSPSGEVRLLDFGIAKLLDTEATAPEHTRTGVRAFTLHYAAPEQVRGEPVSTMSDVYALGVVLYELLTDARPYRLKRESDAEWEEAILQAEPLKPSQTLQRAADTGAGDGGSKAEATALRRRARIIAGDLDNIVLKALAKKPEQRYSSVEALALDLQRYQAGRPVQARPQSVGYRLRKYVARHRWALATALSVTAVLSTALGIVAWQAREAVRESSRAQAMQDFVASLFETAANAPRGAPVDLRALLDAGIERGNRELARQPRARAELFGMVARLRLGLGDDREAMALLDEQARLLDTLAGVPASVRIESLTLRGRALRQLGRPRECVGAMQPWLDNAQREQAQLPSQAAEFYGALGRCRRALGERRSARRLFERALELRRDVLDDKAGTVENLVDLAALHADAGEQAQALAGLRQALAQLRQQVGDRHPLGVTILRSIGAQQRHRGDNRGAERSYREALALAESLHGPTHPETLAVRRQLAAIYIDQGRFLAAEQELRALHPLLAERLGEGHRDVGASWNSLGVVAWELGDLDTAQHALARAVAIWRAPEGRELLADGLANQAMVLQAAGRAEAALEALREARRLRAGRLGQHHPLVGETDRLMGEVLAALGRDAAALARLELAADATSAGYGPGHPHARRAALSLARLKARTGDAQALERMQTLAALRGDAPGLDRLRWRARAYAGEARCRTGDAAGAAAALAALREELRAALPDGGAIPREVAAIEAACAPLAAR